MPLEDFFVDQLDQLKAFLAEPGEVVRAVQIDEDMKSQFTKLLTSYEDSDDCPHAFIGATGAFSDPDSYFKTALEDVEKQCEQARDDLAEGGVALPKSSELPSGLAPVARFAAYTSAVANALPDSVGSFTVLLAPETISDNEGFSTAFESLAEQTDADWAKYIVFDPRQSPLLAEVAEKNDLIGTQVFYLSPHEIEEKTLAALDGDSLDLAQRKQHLSMAGAFAFTHKRYDEAEKHQLEALALSRDPGEGGESGEPVDANNSVDANNVEQGRLLYELGNTQMGQERLPDAEASYMESASLCLEAEAHPIVAMVLTNLGACLHRQQRPEEAFASLDAADETFEAIGNVPGQAYVLDTKAQLLAADKRNEDAEFAWRKALALYEGIEAPHLADVRDAGRLDIVEKLRRFFKETKQTGKLSAIDKEPS